MMRDTRHPPVPSALMMRGVTPKIVRIPASRSAKVRRARFACAAFASLLALVAPHAAGEHPVSRGVRGFTYHDEFYPTFRRARGSRGYTPLLRARLAAEFRAGHDLADDKPALTTVAWAYERANGGRSFTFSGAHYLTAFDEPALRTMLLNAIVWTAKLEVPRGGARSGLPGAAMQAARMQTDTLTFHRDPQRTGWNRHETTLTPKRVAGGPFGLLWESPQLDGIAGQPPRLYASPLYVDQVHIAMKGGRRETFPVVFAATNTGYVYAVNAFRTRGTAPGTILWRTQLGAPCRLQPAPLDGIPTGVLSTPVIDPHRRRIYITHCDPGNGWQAYALDLGSGAVLAGWPVRLDEARLNALNRNAGPPVPPTRRFDFRVQRGALNLSPDGESLYVTFGETETGWIAAIDTAKPRVASAFAAQAIPHRGGGGMWGAGGPAVDEQGNVFVVTGTGYNGFVDRANDWTQSVLMLAQTSEGFVLRGTYTPFNHCNTATMDIDLGSGGAMLLPEHDASSSATPRLLVVGGKQGNAYLLDRARLPGRLDRRPPCSDDPASDASLLPPDDQPQFAKRGPLNVFGPYSEKDAAMDLAHGRSVPATFRDADGKSFVFMTGSTRKEEGSTASIPPSLARLEVVTGAGGSAYLRIAQREVHTAFENPGSPFVTSNGPHDAIVWVLDENTRRSAPLAGPRPPQPVLYAFDAMTLALLWKSQPGELYTSGKYNEPAFARGTVFVGTDRIQAFGLGGRRETRETGAVLPAAAVESLANAAADGAVATASITSRASAAIAPPQTVPDGNLSTRDGKVLYEQRCAACHDHPQGNIPPRAVLSSRSQQHIVDALTQGAMRPFAQGLGADEVDALARYLQ